MKAVELRKFNAKELNEKLIELKAELFHLRFQHAINQLENPARINVVKHDIARIHTVLKENELNSVQ